MRGEIPQQNPELLPGVAYPIWTEQEVATWIANPKSPDGWFYGALRPTDPTPRVYRKPFLFGGNTISILLSDQPLYVMQGRSIIPYLQETLPSVQESNGNSPLYLGIRPESGDYHELTGRRVKLWTASHTIRFGNGQYITGTLETRSKLHSQEDSIISIHTYNDEYGIQHPLIVLPHNPQLVSQTQVSFHDLRQSLRDRPPNDRWNWMNGSW